MTEDPEYTAVAESAKTDDERASGTEIEMIESGKSLEDIEEKNEKHVHPWSCPMLRKFLERIGFHIKTQAQMDAENNAPRLPPWKIFKLFLWFGCRAFGGPVAQIALMKQELVVDKKWITTERFNRVYSVYQILPGPEATEFACYFGLLSGGRLGSFLGGLGFILPGFAGMLLWSYIYVTFGIDNEYVQRSFRAVQNAVAAMIFRATYKLADGALKNKKKKFSWDKGLLCMFCFLTSVIGLNFFIALAVAGVMNTFFENKSIPYRKYFAYLCALMAIGFYVLYVILAGRPSGSMIGGDIGGSEGTSYRALFELGLIAGMVTFGGAYTTLPFIYAAAVQSGGWLSQRAFLDAIAITNMMPTPLVMFVTLVGYVGHGVIGAIVMSIGIFIPAFSFTIIGHEFFEAIVDNKFVEPFLDGVGAAVIGLLTLTAFQFVKSVVETGVDAVAFLLAFCALFHFTDKYTAPLVLIVAAIAGQVLY
eukprot:CAMPEP_0184980308 /NCGR_PEP_ID=MMETSP1098-20130426/10300_1 /TAXON_ID=89044 /ORGANISM="Spumella elongata, Strain CCAP 955/1" /LENGTH=476 /DNA_ID=CAMNT_0027503715 /DNA_START=74 /DNA_END=1504 /DNA_ORIENTATION=-